MAALTTQKVVDAGTAPVLGAASVSDTAQVGNGHNTFVVYKNTGDEKTLTITPPGDTPYGEDLPAKTVTIAATTGEVWVPLRSDYINSSVAGVNRCTLVLDDATGVTVAVVQVG